MERFDTRIVSLQVAADDYAGGNHDARSQIGVTWDLAKQRPVTLDESLSEAAAGRPWRSLPASRNLREQLAERGAPNLSDGKSPPRSAAPTAWLWGENEATVDFSIDLIGGLPGRRVRRANSIMATLSPFMVDDAAVK